MRSARDGEADFVALYRRHYWDVLLYARRRVDEETARDVAAETFLVALRRPGTIPDRPLPWLYSVARHVLANEIRARSRRERLNRRVEAAAAGGAGPAQPRPSGRVP